MDDFIVFFFSSTPLESFAKSTRCFPFRFDFDYLTPVVYAKHQRNARTSSNGAEKNNFRQIQTRRVFPRKHMPSALMAIRSRVRRFARVARTFYLYTKIPGKKREEIEFIIIENAFRIFFPYLTRAIFSVLRAFETRNVWL